MHNKMEATEYQKTRDRSNWQDLDLQEYQFE